MTRKKTTKVETKITETEIKEIKEKLTYDEFIPKHPKRKSIYIKFYDLLIKHYNKFKTETFLNAKNEEMNYKYDFTNDQLQKIALNIEKGIFNHTLTNHGVRDWNNMFEIYYIHTTVKVYANLNPDSYLKNVNLIHRLFYGEFKPEELAYFDAEKRFPERYREMMVDYEASLPKYAEKVKVEDMPDGAFKCGKCKSWKTSYYQLQTRSAKIIGWKSTLLITSWLCYWKNSCSPSMILKC
jgi:DNA-directed RNA polymerase subunit M/transcription elongation factor TFIIS